LVTAFGLHLSAGDPEDVTNRPANGDGVERLF